MNEVTDDDCVVFDGYVKKWQRILNLEAWRIERGVKRPKRVMAEVTCNDDAKLAVYRIGPDFGAEPVTPESLESTALHEVLHVFLRNFKVDQCIGNEHEAIHVLEKLLMKANLQ